MIRLIVLESQTFFRIGIKVAFEGSPDIQVAGEAQTGAALFRVLDGMQADVALLGVNNPCDEAEWMDIARHLRSDYPAMKILAIANEDTVRVIQLLMAAGIDGYIGKRQANREELEKAVRMVAAGKGYTGRIDEENHFAPLRGTERLPCHCEYNAPAPSLRNRRMEQSGNSLPPVIATARYEAGSNPEKKTMKQQ